MKSTTTNYKKHSVKNPISRFFLDNFYSVVIKETKKLNPSTILDVGCGEGFTLDRLSKEKIGKKLSGIDNMDEAIKIGKKLHSSFYIKKGDIYKLPFKNNSFDLVLCMEVLEHLERPEDALKELKRVSKKYVLLSVPNEPLFTIQRILRGQSVMQLGNHPEHIQHWNAKSFKKFVSNNLDVVVSETPLPWILIIAKK